ELQARGCQSSREESEGGLGAKRRPSSVGTLYPLSYRRPASSVALVDVAARIVTLRLAEPFVISREAADTADVVQVEIAHDGVVGYGEGAPIERYGESATAALEYVEAHANMLGDDPWALDEIESGLPRE